METSKQFWVENLGQLRSLMKMLDMFLDTTRVSPTDEDSALEINLIISAEGKGTRLIVGSKSE